MKHQDKMSRPDDDSPKPARGTWIIRPRRAKKPADQMRLPLDDVKDDVDVTRLSDEEFRMLLASDESDNVDDLDWAFDERPDPNFLAQFRKPMTEAEEEEFAMAIMEAIVSAFEEAFGKAEPK